MRTEIDMAQAAPRLLGLFWLMSRQSSRVNSQWAHEITAMASSPCRIFLGAACRCNCIPNFAVDPGSDTVLSIWVIRDDWGMEQEGLEPTQTPGVGWKKETGKISPINWWKLISAGNKQQAFLFPRQESGMQLDRKIRDHQGGLKKDLLLHLYSIIWHKKTTTTTYFISVTLTIWSNCLKIGRSSMCLYWRRSAGGTHEALASFLQSCSLQQRFQVWICRLKRECQLALT